MSLRSSAIDSSGHRPVNSEPLAAQHGLANRPRRLRYRAALRQMVRETTLQPSDLIFPIFVTHGRNVRQPIASMPGISQLSVDQLAKEVAAVVELGIPAILLFGLPAQKDAVGVENFAHDGIVQQAIRAIKDVAPDLIVITDVCLCEYTDHGHCGVLHHNQVCEQPGVLDNGDHSQPSLEEGYVLNDETLPILADVAISHVQAGADIVAPSGMIDGMVGAIRMALDSALFSHIPIMSYAVKYASAYYGPFRDAADGAPKFGDRKTHQMDPANVREALREAALDKEQGADFLMVKPGLAYLDVVRTLRDAYPEMPLVAYNVSGEYAMIKAATQLGWLDERSIVLETLLGFKRAGADLIITYHAKEAAQYLSE